MTNYCDICGEKSERQARHHSACLRRLFGTPLLPSLQLSRSDVLIRAREMAGKMSISGVQPKLSFAREGSRLVPVAQGGQYLLKPQTETFPVLPENENACMLIAGRLGITVPEHGLFELLDGSLAYIVCRFDRTKEGVKKRCEDFAQILGQDKYTGSLEQVGKWLRKISSVPGLDAQLFFERALLCFLLGNGDAHLKNFSVLESEEGELRLAPAYDIVCSKLVIPNEEECALTLRGKKNQITRKDFEYLGEHLEIPKKAGADIFHRFKEGGKAMTEQIERSRLPTDCKVRMRQILETRRERIFG